MGTVASQVTRIHDVEGSLTLTSIGGGAGGGANAEIVIQGSQSAARKQSNATDHGFFLTVGTQDVSGAGVHVGVWLNHIHYTVLTKLAVRIGSATTAYHEHSFPLASYPPSGGFIRMWINVARTPEASAGTFVKTGLTQIGPVASLPAVAGNAPNIILDASDFTTTGLLLTGTNGLFQDYVAFDEGNSANKQGVVVTKDGVIFCLARMIQGSATSLVFNDSNFVIVFPNQTTVAGNFMGITVDLQHADTDITWTGGVVRSAGTTRGDITVTGTNGAFSPSGMTLINLRLITLTSGCVVVGGSIIGSVGMIQDGCLISGVSISGAIPGSGVGFLVSDDPSKIQNCPFVAGAGSGHAITITIPGTYTFSGNTFTGYAGSDGSAGNEAIYNDSGGLVTLNISGGSTPSVRNGSGASTVKNSTVTVTISAPVSLVGAEISIYDFNGTLPHLGDELAHTESHDSATFAYGGAADNVIWIQIMLDGYEEFGQEFTIPASNVNFTARLVKDLNL